MSDCAGSRYGNKEDLQILLTKNDIEELPQHKNYPWMARWTKARSNAGPQNDKSRNRLEDVNKGTSTKDSEFMKPTVAERQMVGVSHGNASLPHACQSVSNTRGVVHDVCKELGPKGNERGDESFDMKQKAVKLHARTVVSETYSVRKLSELQLDFQKLGNSCNASSDWSHFAMFEINKKIDNILNPKRRSALGLASLNVNMSTSHVMALSSHEYMMHSHLEDPGDLSSHPSGQKLSGYLSDTMSRSCSKDDINSLGCQIDEQYTSHYFADSKHEPPCAPSPKKFNVPGNNESQIAIRAFHNEKPRRSSVYEQKDATGAIFSAAVLRTEFQKESVNRSNNGKQDDGNFSETHKSHSKAVSSSSLRNEQLQLETQKTESAANLNDSYVPPDQTANTLTANSKQLAQRKGSTEKSTGSCKRKGPCLFEMLTVASKPQSVRPKNSVSSGKSSGLGVFMYATNIGGRLFGTQNESSARTETLHSDTLIASKSSAGVASLSAQKEYGYPNEAKNEQLATRSIRGDSGSKENGVHNVTEHQDVSSKATIASKQSCIPGAGSTNLDLILFQMSRMRNQISSGAVQPPIGTEPSDRWLKRLQLDISDSDIPGSKRPKVGAGRQLEETNCLFGIALCCYRRDDEEMMDHVKEDNVFDKGSKFKDNQEGWRVPAKSMNCWIGRWCKGGTPVFHGEAGQAMKATKPDQALVELGGQFPSIAAMAMMGRAMNKLRPCEHKKEGSFVVWKTE